MLVGSGTVGVAVGIGVGRLLMTVKYVAIWQEHLKSVKNTGQVPPPGRYGMVNVNFA